MPSKQGLLAVSLVAVVALGACSGSSVAPTGAASSAAGTATAGATTAGPSLPIVSTTPTAAPQPSVQATPTAFTSPIYGYSLTLPPDSSVGPAMLRWDGTSRVGHDDPIVDKFTGPGSESFFAFAAPFAGTLDAFAKAQIMATARYHGDTCPRPPEANEPIQIAGGPGVFLAWNCGILINEVVTVRNGMAFSMVARDPAIQAATDPADRALFDQLLSTLVLPG